jgi:hypothetical protein
LVLHILWLTIPRWHIRHLGGQIGDGLCTKDTRLDSGSLQSGLTASVNRVADIIEDYDRFAPVSTRSLLVDRSYERADCTASDPRQISALIETPPVQLVRVTCSDEDGMDETSFFVVVPPAAD